MERTPLTHYWVGGTDQKEEGKWLWSDGTYLIFVIFFTWAKFLETKMYTENMPIFRVKSVKNVTFSRKICRKCQFFALNL